MIRIILVIVLSVLSMVVNAQDISGLWKGEANIGNDKELAFEFEISNNQKGEYKTNFSIPTLQVKDLVPKHTSYIDLNLVVDGSNLGMMYEGKYDEEKQIFTGLFKEGVKSIPLVLKKVHTKTKQSKLNRPQEPSGSLPYKQEEVRFKNIKAGVELAGTITIPRNTNKFPTVLLISGSGPSDRDQNFANHKTFLVLSDYLTRNGIAVLRYDDRGTAESSGDFADATTLDFAKDAISAIEYLKSRTDIDENNIGLIGHSEGGIIAPIVANKMKKDISFIVNLAGTAILGSELSLIQSKTLRPFAVPDEKAYESAIKKAIDIALKKGKSEKIQDQLQKHYDKEILPILIEVTGSQEHAKQLVSQFVASRTTPWSRYFYKYNPADEYRKVKSDVLALYGTNDKQVLAEINAPALKQALEKGRNSRYSVKVLDNLNHLFQESKTGNMSEYSEIEQTFSPVALKLIVNWIFNR